MFGYLVTGHVYLTMFLLSMVCPVALFWLAIRGALTPAQAAVAAVALLFSPAFIDYSTSGLENPLFSLLVLLLVNVFIRQRMNPRRWLTALWFLAALLCLTRPDAVLFAIPFVAVGLWRARPWGRSGRRAVTNAADAARASRADESLKHATDGGLADATASSVTATTHVGCFLVGTLPASLWTLFSIVYYGFPFPNTAYAKLAMGIPAGELWVQGWLYLADSLVRDPLTLVAAPQLAFWIPATAVVALVGAASIGPRSGATASTLIPGTSRPA